MNSRRSFLKKASLAALASLAIPEIVSSSTAEASGKRIKIQDNNVILFQGDSITDAGRDRNKNLPNDGSTLGYGYAFLTASQLLMQHAEKKLQIFNKGISGNKVFQLADRWDTDCLAIKPDILSIHIGVNDFWHTLTNGYTGTIDTYKSDYHKLLDRTKQALPNIKLVICEPFAVLGVKAVDEKWYPTFDFFRQAAKDIANEYNATFVPFQTAFNKAIEHTPGNYWTGDGVHPSIPGAALMAKTWLEAIK